MLKKYTNAEKLLFYHLVGVLAAFMLNKHVARLAEEDAMMLSALGILARRRHWTLYFEVQYCGIVRL